MRSEWRALYKYFDKGDGPLVIHPAGRTGYSVLFVNAFRRATSPPVSIASITKNPVRQRRLGLDRMFPKVIIFPFIF
jgi:hypothetical protein